MGALWRELLGATGIGPSDDFFSLGGDSLSAIRMISRLRHTYGADLTLSALYAAPTLAQVAEVVRATEGAPPETGPDTGPDTVAPRPTQRTARGRCPSPRCSATSGWPSR